MVTLLIPAAFTAPTINYTLLMGFLIVIGAACVGILVEAFAPRTARLPVQVGLSVVAIIAALVSLIWRWGKPGQGLADPVADTAVTGTVVLDGAAQLLWLLLLGFGLLSVLLFAERHSSDGKSAFTAMAAAVPGSELEAEAEAARVEHTEVFPLALFSLSGMLLFVSANNLLVLFVALEILSLPLYVLSALARHKRLASQEAALKYFLLGAGSSAIFLFGVGLLFGYAGGFGYEQIARAVTFPAERDTLLIGGLALTAVGLLFKLGAVPFHSWVPDVYEGSPTPVTAFMAVCTKIAAVGGLLRLFYVAFGGLRWTWQPVMAGVAILTMVVGVVVAIVQTDVKRLLAYSSIVHAGFILTGVVGALTLQSGLAGGQLGSLGSIVFYLAGYGLATLGCFTVVGLVRRQGREATSLAAWAGLGRRYPVLGGVLAIFLLSLAGIPLTAGFVGKLTVFSAAWRGGYWWLVLVAVVASLVAVFIYVRVIVVLFFREPSGDDAAEIVPGGWPAVIVLAVCLVGTLALGIVPGPISDMIARAASFIHAVLS